MNDKLDKIKQWLGTGRINIFGLPMSGKDTVGVRLAEALGARFLSSGMIIRAMEEEENNKMTGNGQLIPTDVFYEWVLPYFYRDDLKENALILSSVGRWSGEETEVLKSAENSGHPIKAAVILDVSEADVIDRWNIVHEHGDAARTVRDDDQNLDTFKIRIQEFDQKTRPVLYHYNDLGRLVHVRGDQDRDAVFDELIDKLYEFSAQD